MKRDLEQLKKRMSDFYYQATTPEGETIILSPEQENKQTPINPSRVKPSI